MPRRALLPALVTLAIMLATAAQAAGFERLGQYGIGLPGSGAGQVTQPSGVAVSPDGTVAVSDIANQRVAVFSQDGPFLRAFGKDVAVGGGEGFEICTSACKAGAPGTAAGELTTPFSLAAGSNEIYVSEGGNHRISVFSFQGQFLRAFGADVGGAGVNVCTTICAAGTGGVGAGQMAAPAGLALDASGRLYVGEIGTNRVDVFDPQTGTFLLGFGKNVGGAGVHTCTAVCGPGVADGTPGSLSIPYGLSIAPNGDVHVAENGGGRVSVFSGAGNFVHLFGSAGEGSGQLAAPSGVAADGQGNDYVGDMGNHRLAVFVPGGFRAYGLDVIPGGLVAPEVCTTLCKAGESGYGIGEFNSPWGIGLDCRESVYVGTIGRVDKWGEPGAGSPPCTPAQAAPAKPSNAFRFGKLRRNRKKGIVTVEVTVPGPGSLVARAGRKLKTVAPQPAAARTLRVRIRAIRKGLRALNRKGRLKGTLRVTFTPTNGDPNTKSRKVTLLKKLRKSKKKRKTAGR
ncbi:MAG TPA: NHL repeat-containing protein [Solirubrobacterales bacterium]